MCTNRWNATEIIRFQREPLPWKPAWPNSNAKSSALWSSPSYTPYSQYSPTVPNLLLGLAAAPPSSSPLFPPFFDEAWWHCMNGGIDNIYGGEWEWSIFLSGPVTLLAKLHHGQLRQQTPSSLPLPPGPHLHGNMDTLDTIIIRQGAARGGVGGRAAVSG